MRIHYETTVFFAECVGFSFCVFCFQRLVANVFFSGLSTVLVFASLLLDGQVLFDLYSFCQGNCQKMLSTTRVGNRGHVVNNNTKNYNRTWRNNLKQGQGMESVLWELLSMQDCKALHFTSELGGKNGRMASG
jgi:hypothetical protein